MGRAARLPAPPDGDEEADLALPPPGEPTPALVELHRIRALVGARIFQAEAALAEAEQQVSTLRRLNDYVHVLLDYHEQRARIPAQGGGRR